MYAASHQPHSAPLQNAADLYLGLAQLVRFPAWPITPLKLAVFAFSYSDGSIGRVMDRIVPKLAGRRTNPRMPPDQLEEALGAVTAIWDMSTGWDAWTVAELGRDREQWESWRREVALDATGKVVVDQPRPAKEVVEAAPALGTSKEVPSPKPR